MATVAKSTKPRGGSLMNNMKRDGLGIQPVVEFPSAVAVGEGALCAERLLEKALGLLVVFALRRNAGHEVGHVGGDALGATGDGNVSLGIIDIPHAVLNPAQGRMGKKMAAVGFLKTRGIHLGKCLRPSVFLVVILVDEHQGQLVRSIEVIGGL